MAYNTEDTDWSEFEISAKSKDLISRFFQLLDTESDDVGDKLAEEIFTSDAKAEFGGKFFMGKEEIRKSRENAWKVIDKRRHKVVKVFTSTAEGQDLLIIGHVEMGFRNGNSLQGEFAGRLIIDGATGDSPKLTHYQVYADTAPIARALAPPKS